MRKTLLIVLHNPKILLIGAGPVGAQKAEVMLRNQIDFDVIAQEISDKMQEFFISLYHLQKQNT